MLHDSRIIIVTQENKDHPIICQAKTDNPCYVRACQVTICSTQSELNCLRASGPSDVAHSNSTRNIQQQTGAIHNQN